MALEFNKERHEYQLDGKPLPSVTQVLDPLCNFSKVDPQVLEAARVFGNHVHDAMALLVRDELDWTSLDPALVPYILGGKRFLDESGVTIIASEMRLADRTLRYAGTLDIVGMWRNAESLFDWKATATIPDTVGPQTAAYNRLYSARFGMPTRKRFCVQLRPNDYRVVPLTDPADWSIFQSALNLHHWKHKHANAA
jgi:hypothetical protein